MLSASVLISEFMAFNDSTLQDQDGDYSDWIEVHNAGDMPVDLDGWYLTDNQANLTKWQFPDVTLGAGEYLIVFASNKNRAIPGLELHTDFRLDGDGEYLALVEPDGITIATEFAPFPQQFPDVSYGLGAMATTTTLVHGNDATRAYVPSDGSLDLTWTNVGFDDSSWASGPGGVGFDLAGDYDGLIGNDVESAMHGVNSGAYIRTEFNVTDPSQIDTLTLRAQYDDGFIAYLNGQEIASRNAYPPATSPATGLIGYWDFENRLTDTASNYQNNTGTSADNLTARNGTARYEAGRVGQALAIGAQAGDLTDLTAPISNDLRLPATYAIEAWIKPTELSDSWQRLVLNWGGGQFSYHLAIRNNSGYGNAVSLFHGQSNGAQPNANGGTVAFNQWQHLAGVADGQFLRVYLNGVQVDAVPYDGTIFTATTEGLGVGDSFSSTSTIRFNGLLDELAMWAVPLTPDQVRSHYEAGAQGYGLTPIGQMFDVDWNSASQTDRPDAQAVQVETIDLSHAAGLIQAGTNVLAIHGLNSAANNDDFLIRMELDGSDVTISPTERRYFAAASPGGPNGAGVSDLGPIVDDVAHEFIAPQGVTVTPLIQPGDPLDVYVPTNGNLGEEWIDPDYVLGTHGEMWTTAPSGVGYDATLPDNFTGDIGTNVQSDMHGNNATAFIRSEFNVDDPDAFDRLFLDIKYDAGFVAYLNGQEVANRNAPSDTPPPPPLSGLVSFYNFDNNLSDTASVYQQYAGASADHFTAQLGTTRYVPGMRGQAIALNSDLNGIAPDDIRRLQSNASPDNTLPAVYTIEAWIYPTALNTWSRLFLNWGGGLGQSYHFALQNGNQVSLFHQQSNGAQPNTQGGAVQLNQWQHVAGVADGQFLRVYLNGVQVASAPYDGTINPVNGPVGVGDRPNGNDGPSLQFQGYLDDLAVWKAPLSAAEILAHYQAGSAGYGLTPGTPAPPPNVPGLVTYYNFDNTLADSASDHPVNTGVAEDDLNPLFGVARYAPGIKGQAIALDVSPTDAFSFNAPDSLDTRLGSTYTIETWIYPTALNGWSRIALNWGAGGTSYHFALRDGSRVSLFHAQSNGAQVNTDSALGVVTLGSVGGWQHIAGVADGNQLRIYHNGTLVGTTPYNGSINSVFAGLGIGDNPEGGGGASLRYQGYLDEMAIWKVPLTDAQIRAHYQAGAAGYDLTLPQTEPLGWDAAATAERNDNDAVVFERIDLTHFRDLLRPGNNVLAIHGLNSAAGDGDFLILPKLTAESGSDTGQPLAVTAQIIPTGNGVDEVTLHYRVMFDAHQSLTMFDDGLHHDGLAGDGLYGALIPGGVADPGEMLRYYITASDTVGNVTRAPLFADPTRSAEYFGTVVDDPSVTSALPILHRFIQNPGAAETGSGTRASVYFNGEFYDNVFIRIRGDTARSWPKKSYKIDFNPGEHFRFDPDLPRVDEINLNTTYTDKSYIRQILAYEAFRDSGGPYSISFPLRIEQNGEFWSVAHFVEQPDDDYLDRNTVTDDDGALYKAEANGFFGSATSGFVKRNRKDETFSDLQAFINGIGQPDGSAALHNFIFDNVNIAAQINYMATNIIIQNIDRTVKNYYAYRDTEGTGEWWMLPWDTDLTFGPNALNTDVVEANDDRPSDHTSHPFLGGSQFPYTGLVNRLLDVIYKDPTTREMFLRRLRTLMDELLQPPGTPTGELKFEQRIDELVAALAPDVALDRAKWGSSAHFGGSFPTLQQEADEMKSAYFALRRVHLYVTHLLGEPVGGDQQTLVASGAAARAFVPTADIGSAWTTLAYDDSAWTPGTTGAGYERTSGYQSLIGLNVLPLIDADSNGTNENDTFYLRVPFTVTDAASISQLTLRMKFDDGFIAYINGVKVAEFNAPATAAWNSSATALNDDGQAVVFRDFNISAFVNLLQDGQNVLAIHGLNDDTNGTGTSSDMLILPELITGSPPTSGTGVGIPHEQVADVVVYIDDTDIEYNPASGNQDEEYIRLFNPNDTAVDISGWTLSGGIGHTFQPGTVIPAGGVLYITPDAKAFRARAVGPRGGQGLLVAGNYSGHISNLGETITLSRPDQSVVHSITTPFDPSEHQLALRITEIMYNPAAGGAEFIELTNIGDQPLNLTGVRFTDGIAFDFTGSAVTMLQPGAFVVVVADMAAFTAAYPAVPAARIAGQYSGALNNAGETLKLEGPLNETIHEFDYDDAWLPLSDGQGPSLDIRNAAGPVADWDTAGAWRLSGINGGTPGRPDPVDAAIPGDATYNNTVDITDLSRVAVNFGLDGSANPLIDVRWLHGDFNGDRRVNITDLSILASRFGQSVAPGAAAGESTADLLAEAAPTRDAKRAVVIAPTAPARPGDSAQSPSWSHIASIL